MWFVTNNIDSHSIEGGFTVFTNIRVLRLLSTDWKSSKNEEERDIIKQVSKLHVGLKVAFKDFDVTEVTYPWHFNRQNTKRQRGFTTCSYR